MNIVGIVQASGNINVKCVAVKSGKIEPVTSGWLVRFSTNQAIQLLVDIHPV